MRTKDIIGTTVVVVVLALSFSGCSQGGRMSTATGMKYNLKDGFEKQKFIEQETGPGLVFIIGGTVHMGNAEQDIGFDMDSRTRQVTVQSFYIDESEITNIHYREFLWFIRRDSSEELYTSLLPDTTVWYRELAYNDPYVENYFSHPAFDDYPVVGVNWHQANVYCKWRTDKVNEIRVNDKSLTLPSYRLPTESEWEYAARGGLENELYSWEGKSLRKEYAKRGEFRANYKIGRGDYAGWAPGPLNDKYMITSPVKGKLFPPNDFGLYHMVGNIAEWTKDTYRLLSFEDFDDLNSHRRSGYKDNRYNKQNSLVLVDGDTKVYRGGSWKDIAFYLTSGARRYEHKDSSRAYIGFRCAMIRVGRPY